MVGGHATVVWLSNNVFLTFQAIRIFFFKVPEGHAAVVGGHATVGWLSNNFFWRFKQFGKILEKVTEGHATVVGGHATVVWLSNNVFLTFQAIRKILWKKSLNVTRQWSEVKQPLDDCQTTFLRLFKRFGKFSKKVTEGHATMVGGHATNDCQTTFIDVSSNLEKNLKKSRWMVTRQWSEVTRPSDDCQTTFLDDSSN